MSEDEQSGRWETTPAELKAEVWRLRGVIDKVRGDDGLSLRDAGDILGISQEQVRQILRVA